MQNLQAPEALPIASNSKRFSGLQAELALRGYSVVQIEGDDGRPRYVVTRWALTKELSSLDDLTGFVQRIGGGDGS